VDENRLKTPWFPECNQRSSEACLDSVQAEEDREILTKKRGHQPMKRPRKTESSKDNPLEKRNFYSSLEGEKELKQVSKKLRSCRDRSAPAGQTRPPPFSHIEQRMMEEERILQAWKR